jgi:hypothetical protein
VAVELRLAESQNAAANRAMNQKPSPTIKRKDQNSTGTLGMVLAAAAWIWASVAFCMSGRCCLSSKA